MMLTEYKMVPVLFARSRRGEVHLHRRKCAGAGISHMTTRSGRCRTLSSPAILRVSLPALRALDNRVLEGRALRA